MPVQCVWPRVFVVGQLLLNVVALNYLYEETVWTKQTWPDFKLSFPTHKVLDSATRTTDLAVVSDIGPFSQSSYSDSSSGAIFAYDDTLPDEVLVLLAEMVKCKACRLLANSTWQLATNWLLKDTKQMPEPLLVQHMQTMCEIMVPRDLLKVWSIVQSEGSAAGVELPPGLPPAMVQTFTLQARRQHSVPSAYEHLAVQQACSQLLSNHTSSEKPTAALPALLQPLKEGLQSYQATWQQLLKEAPESGDRDFDFIPNPDELCLDKHEKCPFWATTGECEKNVNYMIGFTNEAGKHHDGHCKLSCGLCPLVVHSGLGEEAAKKLASASKRLQAQSSQAACTATGACTVPKVASPAAADEIAVAGDGGKAVASPANAPSPAARDAPAGGTQDQNAQAMQAVTKIAGQASMQQSLGTLGRDPSPVPASHLLNPAELFLADNLQNPCFYAARGWWSYEVCFMSHINQFHAEQGQLIEAHSLGVYDYDSTSILTSEEPLPLQHADLLPGMTAPPMATSQYYTSGRMCEVTQWNELYHNAYDTEVLSEDARLDIQDVFANRKAFTA